MNTLSLTEQVKEDCESFERECDFIKYEIQQQYLKPVVVCKVFLEAMNVPKLYLSAFSGYPKVGTVTYGFERPPLGFCGPLKDVRELFKASAASFRDTCGVDDLLKAWVTAITEVAQKKETYIDISHDIKEKSTADSESVRDLTETKKTDSALFHDVTEQKKTDPDTVNISVSTNLSGDNSGI